MGFQTRGVKSLVVAVTVMAVRFAHAGAGELRLADVVAVAVRQSPALERARIDLEAARAALERAEGIEDTHVGALANAAVVGAAPTDPNGDSDQEQLQVSASRALFTGGTLRILANVDHAHFTSPIQRDASGVPFTQDLLRRYSAALLVGLNQPLLRGAGSAAFEAPIRQAVQQRDAAALSREAQARDLVVQLAQSYWQVAFAWRQLEVRKASLELAQKQLDYTEGAIRAEKVSRSEALAVEEAIATRQQDVISAEQDLYERSLALRQLGGLEIGPDAIVVTTEPLPVKLDAAAPDLTAVVRGAFDHSAELAGLEASLHAAETATAAADGAARSKLDLDIAGGPLGAAPTPGRTLDQPGYTVTASVTFDHAIERRTERGGQAVAHAAVLGAKLAERDARARLAVRATRAVQRARAALASVALGDQATGLAEQNITAEQKRFELGKSTNFEVLRRQDELEQARLRQASAVADYLSAAADLDGLSGAILARYGIVMP